MEGKIIEQTAGYFNNLEEFAKEDNAEILKKLTSFLPDSGTSQITAWIDSLEVLKNLVHSIKSCSNGLRSHSLVLEYIIPLEQRRVDALLILGERVFIIEFKGKNTVAQADLDQATAYARDLKNYHKCCSEHNLECFLVLTKAKNFSTQEKGLKIFDPSEFSKFVKAFVQKMDQENFIKLQEFLSAESYRPLPSLIKAARNFFSTGNLTQIHKAASETTPTVDTCLRIIEKSSVSKRRALILINGVPGAGKTLVGLKLAHYNYENKLPGQKSMIADPISMYLSGPGPLGEVLQHELQLNGEGGKTFVRKLNDYVYTFTTNMSKSLPYKIVIYDEAQRAWDQEQVASKNQFLKQQFSGLSQPEILIKLIERVPEWCVMICLVGTGQELHVGEEGGVGLWKKAIDQSPFKNDWDVYVPNTETIFHDFHNLKNVHRIANLHLNKTIRFQSAEYLIEFVERFLDLDLHGAKEVSTKLENCGYHLRMTHDIEKAKKYLFERYKGNNEARYGIVCSSRDKDLNDYLGGIKKGYENNNKCPDEIRPGQYAQWFTNQKDSGISCCNLDKVATEFAVQGLELDFPLLTWGTDLIIDDGKWSTKHSYYSFRSRLRNPRALSINAYRVLLTRGREGILVFVPPIKEKTRPLYQYLKQTGFEVLD